MNKFFKLSIVFAILLVVSGCNNKEEVTVKEFDEVDATYLEEKLGSDNFVLVDARHNSYFIGNLSPDVKNGGHITGATDFSSEWLDVEDVDARLELVLADKGLTKDKEVVVYATQLEEANKVATYLETQGITDIKVFNATEYINNNPGKLTSYANYQYFLPAYGVNELVEGRDYQGIDAAKVKFFEVSWGDESTSYAKGHIPKSVHINTDEIESPPLWSLNEDAQLIEFLNNNGIMKDDTIVFSGSNGHMAPSRLAVIVRYLGVDNVYILNGGTESYERAGYKLETTSNPKTPQDTDLTLPLNEQLIDNIDEAKDIISDENSILLDIRTKDEWLGNTSGYSDLENQGRIKGAVFHGGTKGETPGDVYDYTNVDGTMRNFDEVLLMWDNADVDYTKHLSFYCGSGWRTAEVLMYANTYGLDNISMYSNGWYEWSNLEPDLVEQGE